MNRRVGTLLMLLTTGFLWTAQAGGSGRITQAVLSSMKDGAARDVIPPDAPRVWLRLDLAETPPGTTLRCAFIATSTGVAPPDYRIDEVTLRVGGAINRAYCSLSRPNAGWPPGEYRVEVFLGQTEQPTLTLTFKVSP